MGRYKGWLLACAALAAMLEAGLANAQSVDWQQRLRELEQRAAPPLQTAQAEAMEQHDFSIAAQPLASALNAFGRQANLQVTVDLSMLAGLTAQPVAGRMSAREALQRLLAGTGLVGQFAGDRTVLLARVEGDALQLGPVRVEGTLTTQNAIDSPPGFVATHSAVATKTDTPLLETPQSISVITRDEIRVRNAQSDAQLLLYTPGVWAQPFGGDQNQLNPFYYIRGFQSAFGGSYVDGLVSPVNYRYEPFDLERVDVFRGPTSTLYGQSDPGGMINRISKRPTEEFQGELQLQGGTYDRFQGAADIGGPIDPERHLLYRVVGLVRNADAPFDYDFDQKAPDERKFVAPSFTINPWDDTSFTVLGSYLDDEIGQEQVVQDANGNLTHISLTQPGYGVVDFQQELIGYELRHRFSDAIELRQNLRYAHMNMDYLGFYQAGIDPATQTVQRWLDGFYEERNDLTVDTQLEGAFETGPVAHRVLVGVDYQHLRDWVAFTFGLAPDLSLVDPDYDLPIGTADPYVQERYLNENVGVYLQEQAKLFDQWVLTLGGRHDWARGTVEDELYGTPRQEQTESEFTYRAGLTYLTDFGLAPYVSYATSFFPTGGADINGTPFKPTTGEQFEVGLKYEPNGFNGFFTLAAYDLTKQNVLTADPVNPNFRVQTGEVRSRGIEVEGVVSLAEGLDLTASYSFNDAEVTKDNPDDTGFSAEGKRPVLTPAHLASAWLDYTFQEGPLRGLLIGGGARYVSSSYADPANTIRNDNYTLFDATIAYDFGALYAPLRGAAVAVNAVNLFDKDYSTCFTAFDCRWGAGRTVLATLSYRW
jgi:iron complex outermembrane recepter protein